MKEFIVICSILMLVGCAGVGFNLEDNPVVNRVLLACGDVPVSEFGECAQAELDKAPGTEEMTVAELIEILKAVQPSADTPTE